jgi:hypothetical protein
VTVSVIEIDGVACWVREVEDALPPWHSGIAASPRLLAPFNDHKDDKKNHRY